MITAHFEEGTPSYRADVLWFEENPNRSYRARKPFFGELNCCGIKNPEPYSVLVKKIDQENHVTLIVNHPEPVPDHEPLIRVFFEAAIIPSSWESREGYLNNLVQCIFEK